MKTVDFSEDLQPVTWNQLKEWTYVSIEGQGHFLTLAQGHLHTNLKLAFLRNHLANQSQILHVSYQVQGNEIYWHDAGHMTKMAAMPIYGKNPSKIFFSGTGGPISMKLGM